MDDKLQKTTNLTDLESHFAFGENWAADAKNISPSEINEAITGLRRLLGNHSLAGKRFLDIGSGSGIHSLAALHMGADEILAIDLDPNSVSTTEEVLNSFSKNKSTIVKRISVFDLEPESLGTFDVVYSWGVLHHTGDMNLAIQKAAAMVAPGGQFVFALYHKTWLCPLWKREKQWYSSTSSRLQMLAASTYITIAMLRRWIRGEKFKHYLEAYRGNRGMDFHHDVHDWLGGYPYESTSPIEIEKIMQALGFGLTRRFTRNWFGAQIRLFGSGCDEYIYYKKTAITSN